MLAIATLSIALALSAMAASCARKNNSDILIRDCVLPTDQRQSFKGHWRVTPVKVAFAPGFSTVETNAVVAAFKSWNIFAQASRGYPLVDYADDGTTPRVRNAAPPADWEATCRSTRLIQGSQFTGAIMLYKQRSWRYDSNAIAVSSECHDVINGAPNSFYNAQIEFNTLRYFAGGSSGKMPDIETIALHEIGHILGLDHSCEGNNARLPRCANSPAAYIEAVMYPEFRFDAGGAGEQKRTLKENDQGRANCIYEVSS